MGYAVGAWAMEQREGGGAGKHTAEHDQAGKHSKQYTIGKSKP